jgi:hypothetical protein
MVEVIVLTFSHPPPFSAFPLEKFTAPVYVGCYMLPGFSTICISRTLKRLWIMAAVSSRGIATSAYKVGHSRVEYLQCGGEWTVVIKEKR